MHVHSHHHRRLFIPEGARARVIQAATALPTLLARSDDSDESSDGEDRCAHSTTGVCERPSSTASMTTIPVILGIVIPLALAIIVMLILHRRHVKKLAQEDRMDKYKSYDFGLDDVVIKDGNKKNATGMVQKEKCANHQHGISLDLDINTCLPPPSVLGPPGGTSTLSLTPSDISRSSTPRIADFGTPSPRRDPFDDRYAESMSAKPQRSPPFNAQGGPQQPPSAYIPGTNRGDAPNPMQRTNSGRALTPQPYNQNMPGSATSDSHNAFPPRAEDSVGDYDRNSTQRMVNANGRGHGQNGMEGTTTLDKELGVDNFGMDELSKQNTSYQTPFAMPPEGYQLDQRRLPNEDIRPLPPSDPTESPDQRASRIRSFYKEYFDPKNKDGNNVKSMYFGNIEDAPIDSMYGAEAIPPMPPMPAQIPGAPFSQPLPRRAVTPPPRMPSEAFTAPDAGYEGWDSRPSSRASNIRSPSIRVQSSVSNRYGPIPPPPRQQKRQPPPQPLQMVPTPHAMTDDSLITLNPIDFAPAQLTKAQREGRAITPQNDVRVPYQPLPTHIPLASSYDDLAIMPSP
ncbi:hypothetical protein KEM54_005862, partial [Ascosphaera aggregata]